MSLITAAQSINPVHLRTRGVPAVFNIDRDREGFEHALHSHSSVGSLGHSAVGEAELEIRGWYDAHPTARKGVSGFPPGGTGNGVAAAPRKKNGAASSPSAQPTPSATAFPVDQAIELMRVKVSMFSVCTAQTPDLSPKAAIVTGAVAWLTDLLGWRLVPFSSPRIWASTPTCTNEWLEMHHSLARTIRKAWRLDGRSWPSEVVCVN